MDLIESHDAIPTIHFTAGEFKIFDILHLLTLMSVYFNFKLFE